MQRHNLYYFIILIACYTLPTYSLYAGWESTNGPFTAAISHFYTDGSILLTGTTNGIYRSSDAGEHWRQTSAERINDFCTVGNVIYAGTYHIIASHDVGQTWNQVSNQLNFVKSLVFHRGILYADAEDKTGESGVYISSDSGQTWTLLNEGLPRHAESKLIVANDHILIGIANLMYKTDGGIFILDDKKWKPTQVRNLNSFSLSVIDSKIFVGKRGVIYVSDDNGITWSTHTESLPLDYINTIVKFDNTLFAGTSQTGIWVSNDEGITWSQNLKTPDAITVMVSTDNALFAGTRGEGILTTSNKGLSWIQKNNGLYSIAFVDFLFADHTTLYAIDEFNGTLSRSNNKGTTWEKLLTTPIFLNAVTTYNNRIILAPRFQSIVISDDNGRTWYKPDGDVDNIIPTTLIPLEHTILASGHSTNNHSELLLSEDGGISWQQVYDLPFRATSFTQHGNRVFAKTTNGIFSSDDEGRHWTARNTGFSPDVEFNGSNSHPIVSNGTAIFVSVSRDFYPEVIYVSENNGESWHLVPSPSDTGDRIDLITSFGNYVFVTSDPDRSVYMTLDNGQNWKVIDVIPDSISLVRSLTNDGTYLYAGTYDQAVWRRALSDIITTSVNEPVASPHFLLYPQPMSETALLELGAKCDVHDAVLTLTTLDGRLVLTQPHLYGHSITIRRAGLPAAAYMFILRQDARAVASGIVVME